MEFAVHYTLRKGYGPDWIDRTLFVFLDDLDPETNESDILDMVRTETDQQLTNTEEYHIYGKNWRIKRIERI